MSKERRTSVKAASAASKLLRGNYCKAAKQVTASALSQRATKPRKTKRVGLFRPTLSFVNNDRNSNMKSRFARVRWKPGQIALQSGQYAVFNHFGRYVGREVTVVKGEPFPPARTSGYTYVLVDATRHTLSFVKNDRSSNMKSRFARIRWKPGQIALQSGQYAVFNHFGRYLGREITVVKGEPFPPARNSGYSYVLVDATRHQI